MEPKTTIVFCDSIVNNVTNGRLTPSIVRPFSSITPRHIPGNYTFAVFFSIENISVGDHKLQLVLYNTDEEKIFDTNIIELNTTFNTIGEVFAPIEISAEIRNAILESAGTIKAVVLLDNNKIGENTLEVVNKKE